ncbi:hypothetical protein Nans01_38160 [Nocardiopsis ansamitocini]|uniref:Uncharacterized protein n=1 Tax=Nocardiopsis ansamitocini TaxID=1670832 RepID=A0A9W6P8E7_9ACTN|nr:hypothetical protein Nans01_38160 [Nocardiopsis ansamitocini]
MAADRGGRQSEPLAQHGRRDRTMFENEAGDPGARAGLGTELGHSVRAGRARYGRPVCSLMIAHVFHNISVA